MIVCSCNVLSDRDVRAVLGVGADAPRTPAQVHGRLGRRPQCGRCAATIRKMLQEDGPSVPVGGCGPGCACAHAETTAAA